MALAITDLKKGTIFELDGVPYKVIDYAQKVMGRGGSIVNVRIKSLVDGRVLDKTFKGSEQLSSADVTNRSVQYLYRDKGRLYFMDSENYEQLELPLSIIGEQADYLKEGEEAIAQLFKGQVINIELPKNVIRRVTYTEDVVKGDTTNSVMKDATIEGDITIKVPSFIKLDDLIKIDTRTGNYIERSK